MNEHSFIRSVHTAKHWNSEIFKWKVNDNYAGGVPDCFYEGSATDLWVEYKYLKNYYVRPDTLIDLTNEKKFLSANQQRWLLRRENLRGDTAVIVGCPDGAVIFEGLSWQKPVAQSVFRQKIMTVKDVRQWLYNRTCVNA